MFCARKHADIHVLKAGRRRVFLVLTRSFPFAPLPRLCPSLPMMAAVFTAERSSVYLGVKCPGTFLHVCVYLHPFPPSSMAFPALWLSPESSLCLSHSQASGEVGKLPSSQLKQLPCLAPCAAAGNVHVHACLRHSGFRCVGRRVCVWLRGEPQRYNACGAKRGPSLCNKTGCELACMSKHSLVCGKLSRTVRVCVSVCF